MQCKPRNSKSTRTQLEFGIGKRKETLSEECGLGWDFLVGGGLDWVGLGSGFGFAMDRTSDWRCRRYVLKKARTMMMAPSRIDSATTGNTASIFWSEKHTHTHTQRRIQTRLPMLRLKGFIRGWKEQGLDVAHVDCYHTVHLTCISFF